MDLTTWRKHGKFSFYDSNMLTYVELHPAGATGLLPPPLFLYSQTIYISNLHPDTRNQSMGLLLLFYLGNQLEWDIGIMGCLTTLKETSDDDNFLLYVQK